MSDLAGGADENMVQRNKHVEGEHLPTESPSPQRTTDVSLGSAERVLSSPPQFQCPACAGSLERSTDAFRCQVCAKEFPVRDGITDLRCASADYYFNPVPSEKMAAIIEEMSPQTWPLAIREFLNSMNIPNISWLDNLVVDGRYSWKYFLNLHRDTVMLDLGCGLGNLTRNLAPHIKHTYAMDLTYRRLEFSKKRFEIFNPGDAITLLAAGDGRYLPFPDNTLDCVVLSGVLEWVGEGDTSLFQTGSKAGRLWRMITHHFGSTNPRAIQLAFLKEIRRVLKPNGQIFVGIENRWSYEYFTGRPDHHSRLMYGSLLPRFVATLYSILKHRRPYRTYTYSIGQIRRLFREAGFPSMDVCGLLKGYSELEEIIPVDVDIPEWSPALPEGFKDRIKRSKYFVPAFGILASASPRPWERLQDRVLAAIHNELAKHLGGGRLTLRRYQVRHSEKLFISADYGTVSLIIKLPCNTVSTAYEHRNARMLEAMSGGTVPAPALCARGSVDGVHFFAERHMSGEQLGRYLRSNGRTAMLASLNRMLEKMSAAATRVAAVPLIEDLFEEHVGRPARVVAGAMGDGDLGAELQAYFHDRLFGIDVVTGITHGDFGVSNILVDGGEITGVVDWELGSTRGLPILDVINYLLSVHHMFVPGDRVAESVPKIAAGYFSQEEEARLLADRYHTLGIDDQLHATLVHLTWLKAADFRIARGIDCNPIELDTFVCKVARSIVDR